MLCVCYTLVLVLIYIWQLLLLFNFFFFLEAQYLAVLEKTFFLKKRSKSCQI